MNHTLCPTTDLRETRFDMSTNSQSSTTLTYQDVEIILAKWKAGGGPTPEEQDQFMEEAIRDLNDPAKADEYQENIEKVGVWANEVDEAFDRVTRGFADLVSKYGGDFPDLSTYLGEWKGFNARWTTHLLLSRDVASEQVSILKRFDQVFLDLVEHIVTDQDRQDVILELQSFIDEDHSDSDKMSQGFYALQTDIQDFLGRFDEYTQEQDTQLAAEAERLQKAIEALQSTIGGLNKEIAAATLALVAAVAGAATIVGLLGVIGASATLLVLVAQRVQAELDLKKSQQELARVNAKQEALAHIKTEFDGLKPDINLICEKLGLFGDIWQGVRSDSIRFQTHLKQGMEAVSDERFQREVRLARSTCQPMQAGLEKYATQLGNRGLRERNAEKTT